MRPGLPKPCFKRRFVLAITTCVLFLWLIFAKSASLPSTWSSRQLGFRRASFHNRTAQKCPNHTFLEKGETYSKERLKVYYINLNSREDRRTSVEKQLLLMNMPFSRIEAVDVRKNHTALSECWDQETPNLLKNCAGKIGCKESHIHALRNVMTLDTDVLIFEDDFEWMPHVDPVLFTRTLSQVDVAVPNWDVIGLSMNIQRSSSNIPNVSVEVGRYSNASVVRILEAQTTHGYAVKASYITRILTVFEECAVHQGYGIAIDQCWKPLQAKDKWYGFSPQLGRQAPGYSDIESRNVDYHITK